MRIYISVDMEGASGVTRWIDVVTRGQDYQKCRAWMTADVNAAIAGARAAGATSFVVEENHGTEDLCNILLDEIDDDVEVVRGIPRGGPATAAALDGTFDCMFLVGHHAKGGDRVGICAHTISHSLFRAVRLGGRPVSEGEIFATIAAEHGVPTALIAGDDVVAEELGKVIPGIEAAIVKRAMSRTGGAIIPPKRAQQIISAAAGRAVRNVATGQAGSADNTPPHSMEVEFRAPLSADALATVRRHGDKLEVNDDATTVRWESPDMSEGYSIAGWLSVIPDNPRVVQWEGAAPL